MLTYVLVGGMRGTTWVQIIKAVLLIGGAGIMTIWVLAKYGFNLSSLLGAAVDSGGEATANILNPGNQYGVSSTSRLDFISLALALVLGTAGLPHVLMRFYTVPTSQEARRSVVWAIWLIGIFLQICSRIRLYIVGPKPSSPPRCGELGGPPLAFESVARSRSA